MGGSGASGDVLPDDQVARRLSGAGGKRWEVGGGRWETGGGRVVVVDPKLKQAAVLAVAAACSLSLYSPTYIQPHTYRTGTVRYGTVHTFIQNTQRIAAVPQSEQTLIHLP